MLVAVFVGGVGLWASAPALASHLYMTDALSNRVFPFSFAADGSLTPINCPGSDCRASAGSQGVTVTPNGKFLYAMESFGDSVSPFAIAADGSLTPIACSASDCSTGPDPTGGAVSPDGRFLYVTNATNPGFSPGSVSPFAIAADGSLTPIACSSSDCTTGSSPRGVAMSPNGRFLYVANALSDTVSPFAIAADGSLTPIACSGSDCGTGSFPTALTVSPNGRFLYAVNGNPGTVSPFAIGSDGSLTPIACTANNCAAASSSTAIAVSPNGRFLYTASSEINSSAVSVAAIADDGSLTALTCPGSDCSGGTGLGGIVVSPSGRFLYASSQFGGDFGTISVFGIGANGLLSPVSCPGSNCSTGGEPVFQPLAISPDQAPVAAFTARPGPPGEASMFDGSGSTAAPGQTVARYDWSFGDGTSAANSGATPSHTYALPGNYTVTLTVTDDAGCSTTLVFTGQTASCNGGPSAEKTLTVRVSAPPTAQISAPGDGASYVRGQVVSSSFSCSEGANGPGLVSCLDQNGHPSGGVVDTSTVGSHTFVVTATSKDGQTSSSSVVYEVAAASGPPVPPSNRFVVRHIRVRANGLVSFRVKVPGPGAINVLETAWKNNFARSAILLQPATGRFVFARWHRTASRASTVHCKVRPNRRGRRLVVHHRYKVRIRLWVTYQPTGGTQRKIGFYGLRVTR